MDDHMWRDWISEELTIHPSGVRSQIRKFIEKDMRIICLDRRFFF